MGLILAVRLLLVALWLMMIARVIASWFAPDSRDWLIRLTYRVTEPILAPIRRVLPPVGRLDFSPMVVVIALSILLRYLVL